MYSHLHIQATTNLAHRGREPRCRCMQNPCMLISCYLCLTSVSFRPRCYVTRPPCSCWLRVLPGLSTCRQVFVWGWWEMHRPVAIWIASLYHYHHSLSWSFCSPSYPPPSPSTSLLSLVLRDTRHSLLPLQCCPLLLSLSLFSYILQVPRYDSLKRVLTDVLRYFLTSVAEEENLTEHEVTRVSDSTVEKRKNTVNKYTESMPRNVEDKEKLVECGYSDSLWLQVH